jgi:hypothetical protein
VFNPFPRLAYPSFAHLVASCVKRRPRLDRAFTYGVVGAEKREAGYKVVADCHRWGMVLEAISGYLGISDS